MLKLKYGDIVERDTNQPVIGVEINMIEGTCPKCNRRYYGWALLRPGNSHCEKCGNELLLTEDGRRAINR
jgi:Mrp family chromosome partitioning ATPase